MRRLRKGEGIIPLPFLQHLIIPLLLITALPAQEYKFNKIAIIDEGVECNLVMRFADADNDGLNEIFLTRWHPEFSYGNATVDVWEYRPGNKYELVYMYHDSLWNYDLYGGSNGIMDIDSDGLLDIIVERCNVFVSPFYYLLIMESQDFYSYPDRIAWIDSTTGVTREPPKGGLFYVLDFDSDGKNEIFCITPYLYLYECEGNDRYELVYVDSSEGYGGSVFGDFDGDGKIEFATVLGSFDLFIFENDGDNAFKLIWKDEDVYPSDEPFSGDTDGDGRLEFFFPYGFQEPNGYHFILYEYKATGNNFFRKTFIDSVVIEDVGWYRGSYAHSACGDVDGDEIDEVIWSIGHWVYVYKRDEWGKYRKVWRWENNWIHVPPFGGGNGTIAGAYDLNKNGYDEIILSGCGKTAVYEIDKAPPGIDDKNLSNPSLHIFPNPLKRFTVINLGLSVESRASLKVYDASGRLIRVVVPIQDFKPGNYKLKWDGKDNNRNPLPSGVYFVKLDRGKGLTSVTGKVIIQR